MQHTSLAETSDKNMHGNRKDLAIIVVWYNPSATQISNSKRLAALHNPVLIIDNSPEVSSSAITEVPGSHYYWMEENLGIATALNIGCRLAVARGSEYALMLDQDSVLSPSMLQKHFSDAENLFMEQRVAVVATVSQLKIGQSSQQAIDVKSAITSGSIIRLSAWRDIGGFNNALFIDQVDHDFCIRLRLRGLRILVNPAIEMLHSVGEPVENKFLGFRITSSNHHWLRRYYQVRNSLYLRSWYPAESKPLILYLRDIFEMLIGIVALERDRRRKLNAMLIGALDFKGNRLGAWREKI